MDDRDYNLEMEKYRLELRRYNQDWYKLSIPILISLIVLAITFNLDSFLQTKKIRIEREDHILEQKQSIYLNINGDLNTIFTYLMDINDFRNYIPVEIVSLKRKIDKIFFAYRPYWSANTEAAYDSFMEAAFCTFAGVGKRAKIRATTYEKRQAFAIDGKVWKPEWDQAFTGERDSDLVLKYNLLIFYFLNDSASPTTRTSDQIISAIATDSGKPKKRCPENEI